MHRSKPSFGQGGDGRTRSGSSRDATMRSLLADNVGKAASKHSVATINDQERVGGGSADVAEAEGASSPTQISPLPSPSLRGPFRWLPPRWPRQRQPACSPPLPRSPLSLSLAAAAAPAGKTRSEPAPLTSGVIQPQSIAAMPGSTEPMKPVKVKTLQFKPGPAKLASATMPQISPCITSSVQSARADIVESAQTPHLAPCQGRMPTMPMRPGYPRQGTGGETARSELPHRPAGHGTGNRILGVLPASSLPPPALSQVTTSQGSVSQAMAYADPALRAQPQAAQDSGAIKPAAHSGWIIQVGALESEGGKRHNASMLRATRPTAYSARRTHSPSQWWRKAIASSTTARSSPDWRARSGRGGMQDPEALRYFLHHRAQLIGRNDPKSAKRGLRCC